MKHVSNNLTVSIIIAIFVVEIEFTFISQNNHDETCVQNKYQQIWKSLGNIKFKGIYINQIQPRNSNLKQNLIFIVTTISPLIIYCTIFISLQIIRIEILWSK